MTNPRSDTELVEFIVGEVIRRLTASGNVVVSGAKDMTTNSSEKRELRLDDRLVTLATLDGRLSEVSCVVVPVRAVVTPAAWDELRRRNIRLHKD